MNRTDRLMAYLVIFQSRTLIRAQDLATRFEISERTVYRDIDALCEAGVPIYGVAGEGYRLMEGYFLPPVAFSPEEARSLALALSMLIGFSVEGGTRRSAETASDKIRSILPNRQKREVEAIQAVVNFYAFPRPQLDFDDQRFLAIQRAIHDHFLIDLTYHSLSGNEATRRIVEPMRLVLLNQAWQLNAFCRLRKDVRHFNLDRIDQFQVLRESFAPREITSPRFPEGRFDIHVLFPHDVVRWVRERQHFSFQREEKPTKAGVEMVYRVADWGVIANWLLGWGAQMKIISPHHLRERVVEMARRMVEKHSD